MTSLEELKSVVKTLLREDGLGAALTRLREALPENSKAYDEVVLLEAAFKEANLKKVQGSIGQTELDVLYNSLRARLMVLLANLDVRDLEAARSGRKSKQGSLLYQVPGLMEVEKETRCRVRIAYDEAVLLENIELTRDTRIRDVRIAEVMEVELIDPSEMPAFTIRTFNRLEQFVEKDEYTEWIFIVKPMRVGRFPLLLRVTVIEKIGERERVRDIVLEESVVIIAEPVEEVSGAAFKASGLKVRGAPANQRRARRIPLRKSALAFAALIAFSTLAYAVVPAVQVNVDWAFAVMRDDRDAYTKFAKRHKDKPKVQKALEKIEEMDWQALGQGPTVAALEAFLQMYPTGIHAVEAAQKLEALKATEIPENIPSSYNNPGAGLLQNPVSTNVEPIINEAKEKRLTSSPPETEPALTPVADSFPAPMPVDERETQASAAIKALFAPEKMVYVKGGTFWMGCTEEQEKDCEYDEKPKRQVTVKDFYIGKYEVTQTEWRAVMGSNRSRSQNCDKCPVEKVSWYDVQEFIGKLNKLTGQKYRLPTEAEWEYAARGGQSSKGYKYAGGGSIHEVAWYNKNSGGTSKQVGKKTPNELGLHDMSGNAWEWVQDCWYRDYSVESPSGDCALRVLRGGSWFNDYWVCRISCRNKLNAEDRNSNSGFRLAHD